MASAQPCRCIQLYVFGNTHNIRQCLAQLIGTEGTENISKKLWTKYTGIELHVSKESKMRELKGFNADVKFDMECLDKNVCNSSRQLEYPGSSQQSLHKMKRQKSFHSSNNSDIGYESVNMEIDEQTVLADIHAISLDDDKDIKRKILPFLVQFFLLPAIFVIAVDSGSFKKDLYKDVIKELGVQAQMKQDESSSLLVVDIPLQYEEEARNNTETPEHLNKLQYAVLDYHFGNCKLCHINNLPDEIKLLLRKTEHIFKHNNIGTKTVEKMFESQCNRSIFLERNTTGYDEDIALLVKHKYVLCIESGRKKYICKPDDLANEFFNALYQMPSSKLECSSYDFMKTINKSYDRKLLLDTFSETGLIQNDAEEERCCVLPMISHENMPVFDEIDYTFETNALRLKVDVEIIPAILVSHILMSILKQGWTLKSSGPAMFGSKDSYLLVVGSHGLLVIFHATRKLTYIYLCVLRFTRPEKCNCFVENSNRVFERIRETVEAELKKFSDDHTVNGGFMHITGRHVLNDIQRNAASSNTNWIELDLHIVDANGVFSPWFFSKAEEIEREMSRGLSDKFLSDISEPFGYGYKLFFVSLDVPSERLSQIEMQNRSIKDSVYEMLLEWRKRKGPKASIASLRSAIQDSTHVTVKLTSFDDIVEKHK